MSLQRTDTGKMSQPLQELHERNMIRKEDYDTALMKEALAISNKNSNELIWQQNVLIAEQTSAIKEIPKQISRTETRLEITVNKAISQIQAESIKANQVKSEISQVIKSEIIATANEMRGYEKQKIDENLTEIKTELSATAKEIEKQRYELKKQGLFQKIFFWATPVLLFVDTILLIIFMS